VAIGRRGVVRWNLVALLALGDWQTAAELLRENPGLIEPAGGALHLMAKRNDAAAVRWLLEHGADPNACWAHWDAEVTPLHLAASQGHGEIVGILLAAGADPRIRDSKHDSDAIGWAEFFKRPEIVEILKGRPADH
jgi:ankyrin repeat protein